MFLSEQKKANLCSLNTSLRPLSIHISFYKPIMKLFPFYEYGLNIKSTHVEVFFTLGFSISRNEPELANEGHFVAYMD